jgi:DNA-binding CsgD family transcriptional regulator
MRVKASSVRPAHGRTPGPFKSGNKKHPVALWSLFALQSVCCAYFLMDILVDVLWPSISIGLAESDFAEALITVALFSGLAFTANELRQVQIRHTSLEAQIRTAAGAFSEVLEAHFRTWSLTRAEREVAILAIKGFSIGEIADLRKTKQGTIKAQCASVYRKAGVSGRLQLMSVFVDDLLADSLVSSTNPANLKEDT